MTIWHTLVTATGMLAFMAYGVAALLCHRAARISTSHSDGRRREGLIWYVLAVGIAMLALYRIFDLADLLSGLGRAVARSEDWYDRRRPLQAVVVALLLGLAGMGAFVGVARVRVASPALLAAIAAGVVLAALAGLEAVSLHQIDAVLDVRFGGIRIASAIEIASLVVIGASALSCRAPAHGAR